MRCEALLAGLNEYGDGMMDSSVGCEFGLQAADCDVGKVVVDYASKTILLHQVGQASGLPLAFGKATSHRSVQAIEGNARQQIAFTEIFQQTIKPMKPFSAFHPAKILCPVDFSEHSDLALKYAAAGARAFDATLVVFHSARFELPAYFTSAQADALERQRGAQQKQVKDFLRAHTRKVLGQETSEIRFRFETADTHPVDATLAVAQKLKVGLVVMGTHGRGGARRLWLGSVAENVVRRTDVPVFVVRPKQHEFINPADPQSAPALATILCPINFTEASRSALRHAVSLAQQFRARLVTPCIIEPGDELSIAEARRKLAAWLDETATKECDTLIVTTKGHAAEQIVLLAARTKADLVVMGDQRRRLLQTWLSGGTTELVLRHVPAPVLVVPH
jgi:nucleotide-binding universal stress UspA family protein